MPDIGNELKSLDPGEGGTHLLMTSLPPVDHLTFLRAADG